MHVSSKEQALGHKEYFLYVHAYAHRDFNLAFLLNFTSLTLIPYYRSELFGRQKYVQDQE